MIMSILFPDSGEPSVLGRASALDAKDRTGYLPEERGVYRKMRVGAFLAYMAHLKGVNTAGLSKPIGQMLESVGLGGTERKRCEELSKGMTQKVQFLAATIHKPDLLILDEPFSGLDPVSAKLLRELVLAEHRRGATVLFSTHVMPHAEEICEKVVMVHQGVKVLGSLMMAAGSAVNDMREAQSFMMPIMIVLIVPWVLWMPISRDPNSLLSIALSFLPPINSFAMMLRMASTAPPPWWQVWLSIGIGVGSVFAAIWFAAKVFRIGLLLYGKPPSLKTLIHWARSA
jgi:ABC-2 type transport system ATP-binding protein